MKIKLFVFAALLSAAANYIGAQTFTAGVDSASKSDTVGAEIVFYFTVKNISSTDLTLFFTKSESDAPAEWSSSICTSVCFPAHVDSVTTTADFNDTPLSPDEEREVSFHVYAVQGAGVGNYLFKIGNLRDESEVSSFELTASAVPVSIEDETIFADYKLNQNYPNPFNPATVIEFTIGKAENVIINVYDALGNKAAEAADGWFPSGSHSVNFDASELSSGIYFYQIITDNFRETKKMILEK